MSSGRLKFVATELYLGGALVVMCFQYVRKGGAGLKLAKLYGVGFGF